MSTATESARADKGFFGHPRGLMTLFGVEIWERFSFYGLQGILAIYLYYSVAEGGLGLAKAEATSIVGAYGGCVYLSTFVACWVADRLLGNERTLFYSAVLVMVGHLSLSLLPGFAGVGVGLVCVAIGSGGVKGNAATLVGALYDEKDERRDGGFSVFYMGVNIGGLIGPLLTGLAQSEIGFHVGFAVAAVFMGIGLVQYALTRSTLPDVGRTLANPLPKSKYGVVATAVVIAVLLIVAAVVSGAVTAESAATVITWLTLIISIILFTVILTSPRITSVERKRVVSFIPMFVAMTAFFAIFQQQFTTLEVYADARIDRHLAGWEAPVAWVTSINPAFIIIFAPIFGVLWTKLGERQPITPIKFALACMLIGVACFGFVGYAGGHGNSTPVLAVTGIIFLFTMGELLLSPVGTSLSTKLAPEAFRAQMVALQFLAVALGTSLSGTLAAYYDEAKEAEYFGANGAAAIVIGVVLAVCSPFIRKLMSGVR